MDMTDGCGLVNLQALHSLHEQLDLWGEVPTAVQCRIAGAKVFTAKYVAHNVLSRHSSGVDTSTPWKGGE
jgi:hypothetical protein